MTADPRTERVLVLTPTGRDGPMIVGVLGRAGMAAEACRDIRELCHAWDEGVGAAVIAEEALDPDTRACLVDRLAKQEVWSDLPLVILTGGGHTTRSTAAVARALEVWGNVTLLERPLRLLTLISAMQAALRARRRQYEVRRLLAETRQAVEQRDEFLAMLAHELRNPLSPVRNSLEILKQPGVTGAVARQAREMAERQVQHMSRLLDDLLDVARVSRGKIEIRREALDLVRLLRGTAEAVRPLAAPRGQEIAVSLPAAPLWVEGDPTRLEQVVTNLLNNACKYTDPGGKIGLSAAREGDRVVLRVRDNGIGIAPDKLPEIFDPFVQAERRLDRAQGGIGIGLTLVKRLVELHGGTVEASSPGPGRGSEFVVCLPALAGGPADGDAGNGPPAAAGRACSSHRILLVDDNVDAAESLAILLQRSGHEVEVAHNGLAAVEVAREYRPDVVLLDLGLPGLDGYQVARRLEQGRDGRPVLVALTGYGQESDRRRSQAAGFQYHLVKPVDPEGLQELLAGLP